MKVWIYRGMYGDEDQVARHRRASGRPGPSRPSVIELQLQLKLRSRFESELDDSNRSEVSLCQ